MCPRTENVLYIHRQHWSTTIDTEEFCALVLVQVQPVLLPVLVHVDDFMREIRRIGRQIFQWMQRIYRPRGL